MGYGAGQNYNTMALRNGGTFSVTGTWACGREGSYNNLTVNGSGSAFSATSKLFLGVLAGAEANTVTFENSGLVKLENENFNLEVLADADNKVQFAQGYLAIAGNQIEFSWVPRLYQDYPVELWSGTEWVDAADAGNRAAYGWSETFYSDDEAGEAAALADTGYSGLKGYTVWTGGEAIPEPATLGLLCLGGLLALGRRYR